MCFLRQCPVRQQPGVKGSYGEVTPVALHEATRDVQQRGRSRVEAVRVLSVHLMMLLLQPAQPSWHLGIMSRLCELEQPMM
jgi:hypothetical protein